MSRTLLSLLISWIALNAAGAQNTLPLGAWRSYLPYQAGISVTQSDREVYFATPWSVIAFDKEEMSTRFFSRVEGLSNTGIKMLRYNRFSDVLIIVYTNGIVDLWQEGKVRTLNQIKNFLPIPGEKTINDIFIRDGAIVYLATNFGVSVLNVETASFVFTTFTGTNVHSVIEFGGDIYAATPEGLYRVGADNPFPEDFGRWEYLGEAAGFPADYSTQALRIFQNRLFLDVNHDLYTLDENHRPVLFYTAEAGTELRFLSAEGAHLLANYRCTNSSLCGGGYRGLFFRPDGTYEQLAPGCLGKPFYAIEDDQGRVWFADEWRFFRMVNNISDDFCNYIEINSPYSELTWDIAIDGKAVWYAAGALNQVLDGRFIDHGFASFTDGQWTTYNRWTREEMRGVNRDPNTGRDDDLFDILSIAIHPQNGKVYAGSFQEGVIEVDGDVLKQYNADNSSLLRNSFGRTQVGGLAFDEEGNLWVSNHAVPGLRSISVLKADGTWQNFSRTCGQGELLQVRVDQSGFKWFVISDSQSGLLVFDEGDLDNPGDDRCRVFSATNSSLPTNTTNCIAVDKDGDVWVGTDDGVVIFECGGSVFEPECTGTRRIVEREGFGAYLLETENVRTIAVDGANRKWVGTGNGVFLLSPDGEEELAHFTTANSPLLDDNIFTIAVSPLTGEVFIGTGKGIISYQGDAVEGTRVHRASIEVFPNPVRPEYEGPIAIRGLARDAVVKITDLGGKLVFETRALGGQAVWDGRDYNGRRAQSGVYLVFSASNPGNAGFSNPDAAVARILLLN